MSTVCFSGSCKHISYVIFKDTDGYKAEIHSKMQDLQIQSFQDFEAAECWIKKIIKEQCREINEIGRYS